MSFNLTTKHPKIWHLEIPLIHHFTFCLGVKIYVFVWLAAPSSKVSCNIIMHVLTWAAALCASFGRGKACSCMLLLPEFSLLLLSHGGSRFLNFFLNSLLCWLIHIEAQNMAAGFLWSRKESKKQEEGGERKGRGEL